MATTVKAPYTGWTPKKWGTSTYYGKAAVTKNFSSPVYAFDTKGQFLLLFKSATKGASLGIASGRSVEMSNGVTYYLITLKTKHNAYEYAYVSLQDFNFSQITADNEKEAKEGAQALLNSLCESDKRLYLKIIAQQIWIEKASEKGKDVTIDRKKLIEVANAFTLRQMRLKANPDLQIIKLFNLNGIGCNCPGVGIVPLVAGLAIGAGVVLVGITMYYFLRPEFDASKLHSEYLDKNEAELKAKLGPEAYAKLKENVNTEIQEAAKSAYTDGQVETFGGLLKWGAIGFGLFMLMQKFSGSKAAK